MSKLPTIPCTKKTDWFVIRLRCNVAAGANIVIYRRLHLSMCVFDVYICVHTDGSIKKASGATGRSRDRSERASSDPQIKELYACQNQDELVS